MTAAQPDLPTDTADREPTSQTSSSRPQAHVSDLLCNQPPSRSVSTPSSFPLGGPGTCPSLPSELVSEQSDLLILLLSVSNHKNVNYMTVT